jgi:peptide/nickel transport system substrate-binding protein
MNKRMVTAIAVGTALTLGLAACQQAPGTTTNTATPSFNAAVDKVYNPSDKKGGIVNMAISSDWDSIDPGDTYYGLSWNLVRLYGRALTMFKPVPGAEGNKLVPDLAESLGVPSDNGKTWTYKLRAGVKFEDGTPITSKDVKYAVERSIDKDVLVNGPTYFDDFMDWGDYKGVYKSKGVVSKAIETPDDRTIVFHLKTAFGGFDYFAMLPMTVPVPAAKDTGAKYRDHVVSSGPYMFDTNEAGKGFTLKRNPNWDAATDPNRKALPDGYKVTLNVNADDIDNQLLSGDVDVDIAGTGVQPASLGRVLGDPNLKAQADNPSAARLWYTSIIGTVKPFDNINCRKAVQYAADRTGYQAAYGGEFAGGAIATTVLVPQIPGYKKFDLYPAGADNKGDAAKAKDALAACGQPNGFETKMAYRAERPKEKAVAESLQQSLAKVGIKLTLTPLATKDYFSLYVGKPDWPIANGVGLATNGWGADWNDGYGMLSQIVDSRVIRATGGSSNLSVRLPEVDALLDKAVAEPDVTKREAIWGQIDQAVMQSAYILPGIYAKAVTLRGKKLANVFVNEAFGQYDYLSLSVA